MAKVIVIGSGGREHAFAWKLSQSPDVESILVIPGNGGTESIEKCKNLDVPLRFPFTELKEVARSMDLVVVGPEQPLVDGVADELARVGIPVFGPSKKAAELESSKAFSKEFMLRWNIPTARHHTVTTLEEALQLLPTLSYPVVLKASGLAQGKGVLVPQDQKETLEGLHLLLKDRKFGSACDQVLLEQRLEGPEVSVLAFTDGYTVRCMPPAQDHKRLLDQDQGPNTGGMGAYAPCPLLTPHQLDHIAKTVMQPAVDGMRRESRPFVGVLFAGLMLTEEGPMVLEFNARCGDPETQAILPLLQTDLYHLLQACVQRRLDSIDIRWNPGTSVAIVQAAAGYPDSPEKGREILGLDVPAPEGTVVFHAGTRRDGNKVVSNGGRVLACSGVGSDLDQALERAYRSVEAVTFQGAHYRRDIAKGANKGVRGVSYRDAGVDIDTGDSLVERIKPACRRTARPGNDGSLGGFGGLFDLKAAGFVDPVLVAGTDGVGTKLLIAIQEGAHSTIGIDLVAMSVNDVLVQGAEPLLFLDYYATSKLHVDVCAAVVEGVAEGCVRAGCALVGGETAEMPGMYGPAHYDVAGFCVGAVERNRMLPLQVLEGDVILGLASSGVHSNGYSLVRLLVKRSGLDYQSEAPFAKGRTLCEALLEPTTIYVKALLPAVRRGVVRAMAHITGGGLPGNVPRVLDESVAAQIDLASWPLPGVFKWLRSVGPVEESEMLKTFNCGIGMVVIVAKQHLQELQQLLQHANQQYYQIGHIVKRTDKDRPVIFENHLQ